MYTIHTIHHMYHQLKKLKNNINWYTATIFMIYSILYMRVYIFAAYIFVQISPLLTNR